MTAPALTIVTRSELMAILGTTTTTLLKWERDGVIRRIAALPPVYGNRNGIVRYCLEHVIEDLEKAGSAL